MPDLVNNSTLAEQRGPDDAKMQQQSPPPGGDPGSSPPYCTPDWLTEKLEAGDNNSILLMDCRSPNDFNCSHISGAIHVALPTIMLRRLKNGTSSVANVMKCNEGKEKFNSLYKTGTLILYDQDSNSTSANPSTVIGLLLKKLKEDGCRVKLLEGGFMAFQKRYPSHCVGVSSSGGGGDGGRSDPDSSGGLGGPEDPTILGLCNLRITGGSDPILRREGGALPGDDPLGLPGSDPDAPTPNTYINEPNEFPVKVLPYLFLGNAQNSADMECLYKNDIKYILNVTPNVPNTFENEGTFKYMQIPISDHWSQNLSTWFPKAIAFIDEGRAAQRGVLVHCLAGISRSVTVTVAYLMHSHSLALEAAYDFVRACKPNISPNLNFMGQLLDFESSLRCDCRARAGSTSSDEFTCTCSPKYYFSSPTSTTPSSGSQPSPYVPS